MRSLFRFAAVGMFLVTAGLAHRSIAAEPIERIELEIAAERSVGASLQRRWYERLKDLGIKRLRIRQARPNETATITAKAGTPTQFKVVAILSPGDRLLLPGRSVTSRDVAKLKPYFIRLTEEGVDGVTAARGAFGLTQKQFEAIHADLSRPLGVETRGQTINAVIQRLGSRLSIPIQADLASQRTRMQAKVTDELAQFTAGTGLAIMLKAEGLAVRPVVDHGQLMHRVVAAEPHDAGEISEAATWTIGHKPEARLRQIAPVLLESVQVQIEGYTLGQAIDALRERIDVPIFFDHAALAEQGIDVAKTEVRYPARKTIYKSLLSNILFQAKLKGDVRVDEAGKAFFWITTSRKSR